MQCNRQILGMALAVILAPLAFAATIIPASPRYCKPGLHEQPNGPFAVMLFCEDALGSHLGVIYYKNMSVPLYERWSLTDRFWQRNEWGADVTGFTWDDTGKYLFVSTSAIYGSGAVYVLDLSARTSRRLFPNKIHQDAMKRIAELCATVIRGVYSQERRVEVAALDCDEKTEVTARVSY